MHTFLPSMAHNLQDVLQILLAVAVQCSLPTGILDGIIVLTLLLFPGIAGAKKQSPPVVPSVSTKHLQSLCSCIFQLSGFQGKFFCWMFFFLLHLVDQELEFCAFPPTLGTHV